MNYEFAKEKIEKLYNQYMERLDKIRGLSETDTDWLDISIWTMKLDSIIDEYRAVALIVVEMYIELSEGKCENWRELHNLVYEFTEKLKMKCSHNEEIDSDLHF